MKYTEEPSSVSAAVKVSPITHGPAPTPSSSTRSMISKLPQPQLAGETLRPLNLSIIAGSIAPGV